MSFNPERWNHPVEMRKMFVGGINLRTDPKTLLAYFQNFGTVEECVILRDAITQNSRGFGFVTFQDIASISRVLNHGHHFVDGKRIDPKIAIPREGEMLTRTKKAFVGGLSANTTADDLRSYFATFGTITDVNLMFDRSTMRHRGFGFVTFQNEETCEQVVNIHYHRINDRRVECKRAQPKELMWANQNENRNNARHQRSSAVEYGDAAAAAVNNPLLTNNSSFAYPVDLYNDAAANQAHLYAPHIAHNTVPFLFSDPRVYMLHQAYAAAVANPYAPHFGMMPQQQHYPNQQQQPAPVPTMPPQPFTNTTTAAAATTPPQTANTQQTTDPIINPQQQQLDYLNQLAIAQQQQQPNLYAPTHHQQQHQLMIDQTPPNIMNFMNYLAIQNLCHQQQNAAAAAAAHVAALSAMNQPAPQFVLPPEAIAEYYAAINSAQMMAAAAHENRHNSNNQENGEGTSPDEQVETQGAAETANTATDGQNGNDDDVNDNDDDQQLYQNGDDGGDQIGGYVDHEQHEEDPNQLENGSSSNGSAEDDFLTSPTTSADDPVTDDCEDGITR